MGWNINQIAAEFPLMWGNSGSYAFGGWPKPLPRHNPRSNIQVYDRIKAKQEIKKVSTLQMVDRKSVV